MHLYNLGFCRFDRIIECDRGVRIGSGIQNHGIAETSRFLYPGHEVAFVVRLAKVQSKPGALAACGKTGLNVHERGAAIDFRFPCAEEVEIRPIQDVNGFHGGSGRKKRPLRYTAGTKTQGTAEAAASQQKCFRYQKGQFERLLLL